MVPINKKLIKLIIFEIKFNGWIKLVAKLSSKEEWIKGEFLSKITDVQILHYKYQYFGHDFFF